MSGGLAEPPPPGGIFVGPPPCRGWRRSGVGLGPRPGGVLCLLGWAESRLGGSRLTDPLSQWSLGMIGWGALRLGQCCCGWLAVWGCKMGGAGVVVAAPSPIDPLKATLGLSVIHSVPGAQCGGHQVSSISPTHRPSHATLITTHQ